MVYIHRHKFKSSISDCGNNITSQGKKLATELKQVGGYGNMVHAITTLTNEFHKLQNTYDAISDYYNKNDSDSESSGFDACEVQHYQQTIAEETRSFVNTIQATYLKLGFLLACDLKGMASILDGPTPQEVTQNPIANVDVQNNTPPQQGEQGPGVHAEDVQSNTPTSSNALRDTLSRQSSETRVQNGSDRSQLTNTTSLGRQGGSGRSQLTNTTSS